MSKKMLVRHLTNISSQDGFTLVEVLVALIVLAIGLVGLATLQVVGLRYTHSSHLRSQAVLLAYDVIDRIRSNQDWVVLNNGQREYSFNYGDFTLSKIKSISPNIACITSKNCTKEDMAENDMFEWNAAILDTLRGQGEVCRDSTWNDTSQECKFNDCDGQGMLYVIRIQWLDERGDTQSGKNQCFLTTFGF